MYEYKLERVELNIGTNGNAKQDYHQVIHQQAAKGWRLLQLFAPPLYVGGAASYIELVFERETGTH